MKFDFDDVLITPEILTTIESRFKDVNPYYDNGSLPLFTAPMDTVVGMHNKMTFIENKINVVLPRTIQFKSIHNAFNSVSLEEFVFLTSGMRPEDGDEKYLIDIANGHMRNVIVAAQRAKRINPNLILMAGNIANPETYREYCASEAIDYARIGIGNGNGCLTTQQTGIGFPMGSLIAECNIIKREFNGSATKIVADGGMKKYADVIKALALGADYVMIGSIFNKALESSSPCSWHGIKLPAPVAKYLFKKGYTIQKEFRGMSTKKSQSLMGNKKVRTSEGVVKKQKVEYTISQWTENFEHYLRSAMSYTNSKTLQEFIGEVDYNIITQNAHNRYNK